MMKIYKYDCDYNSQLRSVSSKMSPKLWKKSAWTVLALAVRSLGRTTMPPLPSRIAWTNLSCRSYKAIPISLVFLDESFL